MRRTPPTSVAANALPVARAAGGGRIRGTLTRMAASAVALAAVAMVAAAAPVAAGTAAARGSAAAPAPTYCGVSDTPGAAPPDVRAVAYEVMDAASGRVLAIRRPDLRVPPASLTKLATLDLTLAALHDGRLGLADAVPIGGAVRRLAMEPGITLMGLNRAGPTVPLRDLLLGMILPSGNDAAVAVAGYVAGSVPAFVARMNALVSRLHMPATHFDNPDGLPGAGQVTTAAAMAILARHLWLAHPGFARYTSRRSFRWLGVTIRNLDPLVGCDPRVLGMKGGWLPSSGFQLVTLARQGGRTAIVVVLGSPTFQISATASERLLDWGLKRAARAAG